MIKPDPKFFNIIFENGQINIYSPDGKHLYGVIWARVQSSVNELNKCICQFVCNVHESKEEMIKYLSE